MGQIENEASGTGSAQYTGGKSDSDRRGEPKADAEGITLMSLAVLRKAMWHPRKRLTERESLLLHAILKLPDAQLAALVRMACNR
jgi:hypothetical protein